MPSFLHLGLAATLLATVSCAPTRTGFTVHQVSKNKGYIRSGPRVNAETYLKYGKSMPKDVAHAFATQQGTVSASPTEYDSEYLSPVTIGGQTLNLDFDTGSADLWVYSSELSASAQRGHDIYDPSKSSTAVKKSGYTWSIVYGDGSSAKGNVYADTVTVGGVTATSQAVELATSLSSAFLQDTDNDGLLGLAFSSINTVSPTPQKTFFDNVKSTLPSPLFAVTLKKGQPGTYDFGFIDSSKYTGSISYTTVKTSQGFWEFTGTGYAVGSGTFVSSSIDAIADTGTTLLYLPTAIVTAYYAKVSGSSYSSEYGGYIFPCSATLPSFTAGIGSYRGVVPGSYINYAPLEEGSSTCYGGIQRNTGIGISIYGDIFLKAQYVVFDGSSTPRLGFAQQAGVSA